MFTEDDKESIAFEKPDTIELSTDTSVASGQSNPLDVIFQSAKAILGASSEGLTLTPESLVEHAERILDSGKKLDRNLENYMFFYRLFHLDKDESKLRELKEDHCQTELVEPIIQEYIKSENRAADVCFYLEPAYIHMGQRYWNKMLSELTDNAFKFSAKGNIVDILGRVDGRNYELSVFDQGNGFSKEKLKEFFEREKYEQQDLAIGLTIAKKIAEIHGGKLLIDSNPGMGTMVSVSIPLLV